MSNDSKTKYVQCGSWDEAAGYIAKRFVELQQRNSTSQKGDSMTEQFTDAERKSIYAECSRGVAGFDLAAEVCTLVLKARYERDTELDRTTQLRASCDVYKRELDAMKMRYDAAIDLCIRIQDIRRKIVRDERGVDIPIEPEVAQALIQARVDGGYWKLVLSAQRDKALEYVKALAEDLHLVATEITAVSHPVGDDAQRAELLYGGDEWLAEFVKRYANGSPFWSGLKELLTFATEPT